MLQVVGVGDQGESGERGVGTVFVRPATLGGIHLTKTDFKALLWSKCGQLDPGALAAGGAMT